MSPLHFPLSAEDPALRGSPWSGVSKSARQFCQIQGLEMDVATMGV